jgi:hypothetical protein
MWIRSPWWDSFWILSGFPFGVALLGATSNGVAPQTIVLLIVLTLQTGHLLSPLILAWSHVEFRRIMLTRKIRRVLWGRATRKADAEAQRATPLKPD